MYLRVITNNSESCPCHSPQSVFLLEARVGAVGAALPLVRPIAAVADAVAHQRGVHSLGCSTNVGAHERLARTRASARFVSSAVAEGVVHVSTGDDVTVGATKLWVRVRRRRWPNPTQRPNKYGGLGHRHVAGKSVVGEVKLWPAH